MMRVLAAANGKVLSLAFSPDGQALAAAVEDHGVFLWNLQSSGGPVHLDDSGAYRSGTLSFTADGGSLGWVAGNSWRVYDREDRRVTTRKLGGSGHLLWLASSPEGDRAFSQHSFPETALIGWHRAGDRWVRDWDVSTERLAFESQTIGPDGRWLAMLSRKTVGEGWWLRKLRLELRSTVSSVVEAVGEYPYLYGCPLTFSPDGMQLVGAHQMTLVVWPVPELGEPLLVRNDSRKHFTSTAYHPAGNRLYVSSYDATVHVFDTAGWGRTARFNWDLGPLRSVSVSPDGALAAAGSDHGEIVVWDVDL
jgi:WD40 repeat protein